MIGSFFRCRSYLLGLLGDVELFFGFFNQFQVFLFFARLFFPWSVVHPFELRNVKFNVVAFEPFSHLFVPLFHVQFVSSSALFHINIGICSCVSLLRMVQSFREFELLLQRVPFCINLLAFFSEFLFKFFW